MRPGSSFDFENDDKATLRKLTFLCVQNVKWKDVNMRRGSRDYKAPNDDKDEEEEEDEEEEDEHDNEDDGGG